MALVKKSKLVENTEIQATCKDQAQLLQDLKNGDVQTRREAIHELTDCVRQDSSIALALVSHVAHESEVSVRGSIFTALLKLKDEAAIRELIELLHSDSAALRNEVIEILQQLPDEVSTHIQALLYHQNSDIRIFALNILQTLCHPDTPKWLVNVIDHESHVNVCATALDVIAEVSSVEILPALEKLKTRFTDPYIRFAVEATIKRIQQSSHA